MPGLNNSGRAPLIRHGLPIIETGPVSAHCAAVSVSETFIRTWFTLQRQLISGLQVAYVDLHGSEVGPNGLVVTYPDGTERQAELALAAQLARRSGAPVTGTGARDPEGQETLRVACPLHLGRHTGGAVVVEVSAEPRQQAEVLQMLKWGEAWLNLAVAQRDEGPAPDGLAAVIAAALARPGYRESLTALLALLPGQAACSRVALGIRRGERVALEAVSSVADLNVRSPRARAIEAAMSAVLDGGAVRSVVLDGCDADSPQVLRELLVPGEVEGVVLVPACANLPLGLVFCFEYAASAGAPKAPEPLCEACAAVAAPVIALRHQQDRPWWRRQLSLWADGLRVLSGARGRPRRLATLLLGMLFVAFMIAPADYRVSAPVTIEGAVQRAVVAPFDGFVADAVLRAGQRVREGDLMLRLEDREFVTEQRRLQAERAELIEQHRHALATLDHGEANVIERQLEQVRARLLLVESQLERTVLRAPLDGVIIKGDWSRSEGVPVSRGDLLFEVAPLQQYRAALRVSDREIAALSARQTGELILNAMPRRPLGLAVSDIATLAAEDLGEPGFRVEAELATQDPALRPGMQGIAKVDAGERPRWWIWTHAATDWLRLRLWQWLP